eukprot:TRINITY_DN349_c0_g1_i3.p1 TRINITY_DN349_c0_g1~~TRINITY_DN349_c0_g1_i3.p1  ORF type:complete len:177 (+),score=11.63 TRINITY_DN349_c0_g1_i3:112-642(+)
MNRRSLLKKSSLIIGVTGLCTAGAVLWQNRWNYIVIHHSAGRSGNVEILQQVHRQRQSKDPIDAIPYHYIIGNGNGMKSGEVASDWRQEYNIWGAHVSGRNFDHNFRGIGICLIGNLEEKAPAVKQYNALLKLTKQLMLQYNIPLQNVTGHGMTTGERTKCPGKYFPMSKFKRDLV